MKISDLQALDAMGIYALKNEADKRIFVSYGKNMLANFLRLLGALKTDKRNGLLLADIEKLELHILETSPKDYVEHMKIKVSDYCAQFQAGGYTLYRQYKDRHGYKVETVVSDRFLVEVWLKARVGYKLCVGVFRTVYEADEFVAANYKDRAYIYPIYAKNELTIELMSKGMI